MTSFDIQKDLDIAFGQFSTPEVEIEDVISTPEVGNTEVGNTYRVHFKEWGGYLAMEMPGSDVEAFRRECKVWIDFGLHLHIVPCYFVRKIGGVPAAFTSWMEGGSLGERIRNRTLYTEFDPEVIKRTWNIRKLAHLRVLDIAIQIVRGLKYIHSCGLVHMDIHSGNILLTSDWEARITGFGKTCVPTSGVENGVENDIYAWALIVLEMHAGKRLWETGAEAPDPEKLKEWFEQCEINVARSLREVLTSCLTGYPDGQPDLDTIEEELIGLYNVTAWAPEKVRKDYDRPEAEKVVLTASMLNNRAISYLDLGITDGVESCWMEGLALEPRHADSVINYGLWRWRKGALTEHDMRDLLMTVRQQVDYDVVKRELDAEIESGGAKQMLYRVSIPGSYLWAFRHEKLAWILWDAFRRGREKGGVSTMLLCYNLSKNLPGYPGVFYQVEMNEELIRHLKPVGFRGIIPLKGAAQEQSPDLKAEAQEQTTDPLLKPHPELRRDPGLMPDDLHPDACEHAYAQYVRKNVDGNWEEFNSVNDFLRCFGIRTVEGREGDLQITDVKVSLDEETLLFVAKDWESSCILTYSVGTGDLQTVYETANRNLLKYLAAPDLRFMLIRQAEQEASNSVWLVFCCDEEYGERRGWDCFSDLILGEDRGLESVERISADGCYLVDRDGRRRYALCWEYGEWRLGLKSG